MVLDKNVITQLSSAIQNVWNEIGSDVMQCDAECGENTTNAGAMESVLDADRLLTSGEKEAHALATSLMKEHGYDKVSKFLCKHIKLA